MLKIQARADSKARHQTAVSVRCALDRQSQNNDGHTGGDHALQNREQFHFEAPSTGRAGLLEVNYIGF